ncbi:MAG: hypothetical protein UDG28_02595 [Prevotellamassilia sp.]|nr:hypothetical protein [Prevotellamassilia sp.]
MEYILNYIFTEPIGFLVLLIIIFFQVRSFYFNWKRMKTFSQIFEKEDEWNVRRNMETDMVNGIIAKGNDVFNNIIDSINQYLKNNSGSVIDFGLLRDSVDRHCDMVENEIATQTPVPLYLGLVGTMSGVIIGLFNMLRSGAIFTLMSSGTNDIVMASDAAAGGINSLLGGIGFAMFASVLGIILTTISSLNFKKCKVEEEKGKNGFLAWMQSTLLPELPTDTSDALNNLVTNLNRFNNVFAGNTQKLSNVLGQVNAVYASQQKIFEFIHDMDMMKSAKANVVVLKELQNCTEKLQEFNEYLTAIKGYTNAIHRFEELFNEETDRIHILEEIRDFFRQHKSAIAKTTSDADNALQSALRSVKENTSNNVRELNKQFLEQSENYKEIIKEEHEAFLKFSQDMKIQFVDRLSQMPQLAAQLEKVAAIPQKLDDVVKSMEKSNEKLVKNIAKAINATPSSNKTETSETTANNLNEPVVNIAFMPKWMKFSAWLALMLMALVGVFSLWSNYELNQRVEMLLEKEETALTADTLESAMVAPIAKPKPIVADTTTIQSSPTVQSKKQ